MYTHKEMVKALDKALNEPLRAEYFSVIDQYDSAAITVPRMLVGRRRIAEIDIKQPDELTIIVFDHTYISSIKKAAERSGVQTEVVSTTHDAETGTPLH